LGNEGHDGFEAFRCAALLATATATVDSLPDVPTGTESLLEIGFLELDGDAHREGVVSERIEPDEQVELEMDPEDDRRVDTGDVSSKVVLAIEPGLLSAVADLQTMLVGRSTLDRRRVAAERVAEEPDALVTRSLDAQVDRCTTRSAGVQHVPAGPFDRIYEEGVEIAAAGDAIDLGICAPSQELLGHRTGV
jgi:hypothetical protein